MKGSSDSKKGMLSLYVLILFISVLIVFGIFEFRFLNNILNNYEDSIEQIAINKTNSLINEIKAVTENAARKIELQNADLDSQTARTVAAYDPRITNVYLINKNGTVKSTLTEPINTLTIRNLAHQVKEQKEKRVLISDLTADESNHLNLVRTAMGLNNGGTLVLDFRIDDYQKEIIEEFSTTNFKIAVFNSKNSPIIWPFTEEELANFNPTSEGNFYAKSDSYLVVKNDVNSVNWQVFLFKKDTNFEQYRAITIILLVFGLYYCMYQLLVELWGVNSAKSYFDNIDFAILNQVNEGIIISNNAGSIVFANKAAHEIFSERKNTLINVKLKEIMGHIEDFPNQDTAQTLLLKTSDKIWEVIHSPIIKKGKKLGALSVIRANASKQKSYQHVFDKLLQVIPEGVIFVDEDNIIVQANLMAKCYLGSLDRGKSIETVDVELAEAIRKNINTRSFSRTEIKAHNLWCDIAPVYDHDGVYIGSLIVLLSNNLAEWE